MDLASTIEELAAFYNKKKDPLIEAAVKTAVKTAKAQEPTPPAECEVSENRECKKSRYIPVAIKRSVYRKAGGQCTYVDSESGKRCSETTHLEVDHVMPFAMGGETLASNLRIRCSAHNKQWAKDVYGVKFVKDQIQGKRPKVSGN